MFSQVADGDYIIEVGLTPAGSNCNGCFRKSEMDVGAHAYTVVNEYVRVDNEGTGLSFIAQPDTTTRDTRPVASVTFGYLASTPVRFAI